MFYDFFKSSENLRKSSENLRKSSENLGKLQKRFKSNSSDVVMIFKNCRKIFGNLRKCSEILGEFPDVIGNVRNGSQELKSFAAGF